MLILFYIMIILCLLINDTRFVKFSTSEEAMRAIQGMSGYKIANKTLMCKVSDSSSFADPSGNLYVKPLPPEFTEGHSPPLLSLLFSLISSPISPYFSLRRLSRMADESLLSSLRVTYSSPLLSTPSLYLYLCLSSLSFPSN